MRQFVLGVARLTLFDFNDAIHPKAGHAGQDLVAHALALRLRVDREPVATSGAAGDISRAENRMSRHATWPEVTAHADTPADRADSLVHELAESMALQRVGDLLADVGNSPN